MKFVTLSKINNKQVFELLQRLTLFPEQQYTEL